MLQIYHSANGDTRGQCYHPPSTAPPGGRIYTPRRSPTQPTNNGTLSSSDVMEVWMEPEKQKMDKTTVSESVSQLQSEVASKVEYSYEQFNS